LATVDKEDPSSCLNAAEANFDCKPGEGYFNYNPTTGACGCCKLVDYAISAKSALANTNIYKGDFAQDSKTYSMK